MTAQRWTQRQQEGALFEQGNSKQTQYAVGHEDKKHQGNNELGSVAHNTKEYLVIKYKYAYIVSNSVQWECGQDFVVCRVGFP